LLLLTTVILIATGQNSLGIYYETAEKGYLQTSSSGWIIKFSVHRLNKQPTSSL
jgi:hypothetical protein